MCLPRQSRPHPDREVFAQIKTILIWESERNIAGLGSLTMRLIRTNGVSRHRK